MGVCVLSLNFTYNSKRGGVFAPDYQIVPYPSPIMRRQALQDIMKHIGIMGKGTKYIEIGYGSGIFTYEFYHMGFDVYGYELSESAYETANKIFNTDKQRLNLKHKLTDEDNEAYDLLGAYEVLEHCEDDAGVLREWSKLLRKGGYLLLSVPARMKNFGLRDKWAGHIRRYEKAELVTLLQAQGFELIELISYGFPLPKLMEWAIKILVDKPHLKRLDNLNSDTAHKTSVSGIEREEEFRFNRVFPYRLFVIFGKIQRLFYNTDLGIGYVVVVRK